MDSAICPKSEEGYSKLLIVVDICTSFVSAYPSRDLTAATARQHIAHHICSHPPPMVIITDFGSEFRAGLEQFLASNNISLQATTPYSKGTSSTSECAVRLVKRALTKICLFEPKKWASYLPIILNSTRLYCIMDRPATSYIMGPSIIKMLIAYNVH